MLTYAGVSEVYLVTFLIILKYIHCHEHGLYLYRAFLTMLIIIFLEEENVVELEDPKANPQLSLGVVHSIA